MQIVQIKINKHPKPSHFSYNYYKQNFKCIYVELSEILVFIKIRTFQKKNPDFFFLCPAEAVGAQVAKEGRG